MDEKIEVGLVVLTGLFVGIFLYLQSPLLKPLFGLVGFLGIFFGLLKFTTVQEGTAKAIMRFEALRKFVMAWEGYKFDEDWNIVPGKSWNLPGGLRLVGIRGIDKVYTYSFRWQGIEIKEGKEIVVFHEKKIDYILVKPDTYWTKILKAETVPPERIPLDIEWLLTMRTINPKKTLFVAPPNWVEAILTRFNTLARAWTATKTLDQILELRKKENIERLWEEFRDVYLIQQVFKEEWGVLIEENGIEIRDVGLPREFQEAAAAEKKAKLEARAMRARAKVEAVGRASEIMGTFIEALVQATGMTKTQIREELQRDPESFYKKHKVIIDNVITKLAMENRAYLRIETPGATGALGDFLRIIGFWKRTPPGKSNIKSTREGNKALEEAWERIKKYKGWS